MEAIGFSKWNFADGGSWKRFQRPWAGMTILAACAASLITSPAVRYATSYAAVDTTGAHLDPKYGVHRIPSAIVPIGDCAQCHNQSDPSTGGMPSAKLLFTENSNNLCYSPGGVGPCHQAMPANYPADESHRIPEGFPGAGYFEYNSGGTTIHGVGFRSRWPGAAVYDDPSMRGLHYVSPHRNDQDMPRLDPEGRGSCLNCHDAHNTPNPFDALRGSYVGIGGFDEPTYPSQHYGACFDCHSAFGPPGMEISGKLIADYYDSSVNGETAGHQIRKNPRIAMAWPSYVNIGDKLPCYECHNPHGSVGYDGRGPNAFLISDSRRGWSNLTELRRDPQQARRFCLGCHIASDDVPGSQTVNGILMNTLSERDEHTSMSWTSCYECHGAEYDDSTDHNVHNPK